MKNEMETKLIDFNGGKILGVRDSEGNIWMGIRKACTDIGLTLHQADRQRDNIKNDLVFEEGYSYLSIPTKGGIQKTWCLKEEFVTLWLAKISLTPAMKKNNPKTINKLVEYQLKAANVLHNAFMGTEEKKKEFFNDLGIKGEIVNLKNEIKESSNKIIELDSTVKNLIDNSTINSRQSQKLLASARDRVRALLGDAHSSKYKKYSRVYFKNLWLNFCDEYEVGSYKDLCPVHYEEAFNFINNWEYKEVA